MGDVTLTGTTHVKWIDEAYGDGEGGFVGTWFAADDRFRGAWADGDTPQEALDHLCVVIADWCWLKRDDDDLPPSNWTISI